MASRQPGSNLSALEDQTVAAREAFKVAKQQDAIKASESMQEKVRKAIDRSPCHGLRVFRQLASSCSHGLLDMMYSDPSGDALSFVGCEAVLEGAVQHIESRRRAPSAVDWDIMHTRRTQRQAAYPCSSARMECAVWDRQDAFSDNEFLEAARKLPCSSSCLGLPFAMFKTGIAELVTFLCNWFSSWFRLAIVPEPLWGTRVFHISKPSKRTDIFDGYRMISVGFSETRLLEDLWYARFGIQVANSVGPFQDGLGDAKVACLLSLETHLVRASLGFPSGDV